MAAPTLDSLMAALPLAELPRTGWLQVGLPPGIPPETIAAHASMVGLLVLRLGGAVEPPLDVHRATALAAAHDLAEARLGDLPRDASRALPAGAKQAAEAAIEADFFPELKPLCTEYRARETREARFVHLCDKLQMGLFALRLKRAGHQGLGSFGDTLRTLDCTEFTPLDELRTSLICKL